MAVKYCTECGCPHDENAKFCENCGVALTKANPAGPDIEAKPAQPAVEYQRTVAVIERNKWTAFFLCLFLGWAGAHRFYERKYITGIIWLLTLGFFYVGWICDLIFILAKPNPYFVER